MSRRRAFALVELPLMIAAVFALIGITLLIVGWHATGGILIVGGLLPWLLLFVMSRREVGGVEKKERM